MRKIRLFVSFMKERDWLEKMAAEGWLLDNITLGMIYRFTSIEPCEKVYEIERFAISPHSTVADLSAKARALDIAAQFGWQQITHDEDMNYYFVKDKAGDETDEFYDDEDIRKERAERYRRRFSMELPFTNLSAMVIVGVFYFILAYLTNAFSSFRQVSQLLLWIYLLFSLIELFFVIYLIRLGERLYSEFSMSRTEWARYRQLSEKKRFKTIAQLRTYLQNKNEAGLVLKEVKGSHFLFSENKQRYDYFIDTRSCLKKRLKQEGSFLPREGRDWYFQSTSWYELSIANAARYQLEPVAVIQRSLLVYRRPCLDQDAPWENDQERLWLKRPFTRILLMFLAGLLAGFLCGLLGGFFSAILANTLIR